MILTRTFRSFAAVAALTSVLAISQACGDAPTSPTTAVSTTDLRVGTGTDATAGKLLTVHYTGWLFDASRADQKGLQFDTSRASSDGFSFTLGVGQVITGWDRGIVGMKVGGLRRLVIPPSLAYGTSRNGPIPPNATLVFDIELLDAQ